MWSCLRCDGRKGDTTDDGEKNGKGAGFERMGIGLLRERRQITKDPVVIPWWSGVVGFWGLRGASLSSSSRSSNSRQRERSQPSPSVGLGAGGDDGDGGCDGDGG